MEKKLYKNEKLMYFGLASLRIASLAWSLQLFIHYIYVQMRRKHIQTYFYIFTTETSLKYNYWLLLRELLKIIYE